MSLDWKTTKTDGLPNEEGHYLLLNHDEDIPTVAWFDGDEFFPYDLLGFEAHEMPRWWAEYNRPQLTKEEEAEREKKQVECQKTRKKFERDNNSILSHNEMMKIVRKHLKGKRKG